MGNVEEVRRRLLSGERPYDIFKGGIPRTTVYQEYNRLIREGSLSPGSSPYIPPEVNTGGEDDPDPEPELEPAGSGSTATKTFNPITVKRSTVTPTGKAPDVINFAGAQNLPRDAVNAVRGAMGLAVVPSILRMPMPEMLYLAMVTSISEMHWPAMQPQDFIDTVLYQWLDACGYITRPIVRKSDLQDIVDKANTFDPNSPALKQYIKDNNLISMSQVQALIDSAIARAKNEGNGNNGNGHNGGGNDETKSEIPTPEIKPTPGTVSAAVEIVVPTGPVTEKVIPVASAVAKPEPPMVKVDEVKNAAATTFVQDIQRPGGIILPEDILANVKGFPAFATTRLREVGILTVGQLMTRTADDLDKMPNLGNVVVSKIVTWMTENSLKIKGASDQKEDAGDSAIGRTQRDGESNPVKPAQGGGEGQNQGGGNPQPTGGDGSAKI